ncbi:MAG: large conductance mechanosensitive channel [Nocardioidaceae bacterium]|nr:large conductance mechanosensitive channel [Nocardioidaceae bacterium]
MLRGFKDFIMRGNLVELAVAFIIGGAFATVVTSFTAVILSLIAKVTGGKNPDMTSFKPGDIPVGAFLTAAIAFVILAAVVYFFVVTPYNRLQARMSRGEEAAPPAPDIALLTEIRDLLADRTGTSTVQGGGGLS